MKGLAATLVLLAIAFVATALPRTHAASAQPTQPGLVQPSFDLLGDWRAESNSIARVVISGLRPGWVRVSAYGACVPSPCKWGGAPARLFAENAGSTRGTGLIATYDHGFSLVTLTAHLSRKLEPPKLRVETYTHFKDGSGRSDYWDIVYLQRV